MKVRHEKGISEHSQISQQIKKIFSDLPVPPTSHLALLSTLSRPTRSGSLPATT